MSKYGIISGPYFPVFSPNMGKHGPEKLRIWKLLRQFQLKFIETPHRKHRYINILEKASHLKPVNSIITSFLKENLES